MSENFKLNMQVENLTEKEMSKLYKRIDLLVEELFKGDKYCDISITDSIGGIHSEGQGWNPQGNYCGECNAVTCLGCIHNTDNNQPFSIMEEYNKTVDDAYMEHMDIRP